MQPPTILAPDAFARALNELNATPIDDARMDDPTRKHAKVWHLLPHDPAAIDRLSRALRVSPIVAQLLLNRKQIETPQAERFLTAPLTGLLEPEALPGVDAA